MMLKAPAIPKKYLILLPLILFGFFLCSNLLFGQQTWESWMPHAIHYNYYYQYRVVSTEDGGASLLSKFTWGSFGEYRLDAQGDSLSSIAIYEDSTVTGAAFSHQVNDRKPFPGGGAIWTGNFSRPVSGNDTVAWVGRTDRNDSLIWVKKIMGAHATQGQQVLVYPNGEIQLMVRMHSGRWQNYEERLIAVRMDSSGSVLWQTGWQPGIGGRGIEQDDDGQEGSFLLARTSQGNATTIFHLGSNGTLRWMRQCNGFLGSSLSFNGNDQLWICGELPSGKTAITRIDTLGNSGPAFSFSDSTTFGSKILSDPNGGAVILGGKDPQLGVHVPALFKMDDFGNPLWARMYLVYPSYQNYGIAGLWLEEPVLGSGFTLGASILYHSQRQVGTNTGAWLAKTDAFGHTYCNDSTTTFTTTPITLTWNSTSLPPELPLADSATGMYWRPNTYPLHDLENICGQSCSINASLSLSSDTICNGDTINLNTQLASGQTATWFLDNQSNPIGTNPSQTLQVQGGGNHPLTLRVSNGGCYAYDFAVVHVRERDSSVNISPDISFCPGDSGMIRVSGPYNFVWNTGQTADSLLVTQTGNYTANWTQAGGCSFSDAVQVSHFSPSVPGLGPDIRSCQGNQQLLMPAGPPVGYASYLWSTGRTTATLSVDTTGTYWVEAINTDGCVGADTINVTFYPLPTPNLLADTGFCNGDTLVLNPGGPFAQYLWNTGAVTQTLDASQPGLFRVEVVDSNGCTGSDSVHLTSFPLPQPVFSFSQSGNQYTFLDATPGAVQWHWDFGDGTTDTGSVVTHQFSVAGIYEVCLTVENAMGCANTRCVTIFYTPTGRNEDFLSSVKCFPNPTRNRFVLEGKGIREVEVWNSTGQMLVKYENRTASQKMHLNCENWASGLYFLRIQADGKSGVIRLEVR